VLGGVLCAAGTYEKGEKMKVAVRYVMASAINRWRSQEFEMLEPNPGRNDVFKSREDTVCLCMCMCIHY
jgi:hypothetical protein